MKLRTDDVIDRVRLVWLGWDGVTLPVHLPYQQWAAWMGATVVLGAPAWFVFGTLMAVPPAAALAALVVSLIWDRVSPDRPARKIVRSAFTGWHADRPEPDAAELPTLNARHVTLGGNR